VIDPFLLDRPAVISFSGGRTSGCLLRRVLDAFGGALPPDVVPIFCNTGKERPETLDFVERCSQRWGVEIVWLEYRRGAEHKFIRVDYATASRNGEPFDQLIAAKQMLPSVQMRFCTGSLKVKPVNHYARRVLGWETYVNAIGLRADEPRRLTRMRSDPKSKPGEEPDAPLARAGVALADVQLFWKAQPFDLPLLPHESNCDLCFLKGQGKIIEILSRRPDLAGWWIEKERQEMGRAQRLCRSNRFRAHAPGYERTLRLALEQPDLFPDGDDFPDCRCTD
jgi:hypothetical protein